MQTQDIPRDQWIPFLRNLGAEHEGETVTLELHDHARGIQQQASHLPLVELAPNLTGTSQAIDVVLDDDLKGYRAHVVPHPQQLQLARSEAGDDRALRIVTADGTAAVLHFDGADQLQVPG